MLSMVLVCKIEINWVNSMKPYRYILENDNRLMVLKFSKDIIKMCMLNLLSYPL
jgi:hypothetical protein